MSLVVCPPIVIMFLEGNLDALILDDIRIDLSQERGFVSPTDEDGCFDISQLTFASFAFLVWKEIHYGDASAKESARRIANDVVSCACELLSSFIGNMDAATSDVDSDAREKRTKDSHGAKEDIGLVLYEGLSKRLSSWLSRAGIEFYVRDLECFICCDDAVACYDVPSDTIHGFFCIGEQFEHTARWCLDKIDMHDHVLGRDLRDVVDESWVFQLDEFSYLYKALHDGVRAVCIQLGYLDGGSFCLDIDEALEFARRDDVQFGVCRGVLGEPLYRELAVDCQVFKLVDDRCAYMVVLDCSGYDVSEDVVRSFSKSCDKKAVVSLAQPTMMLPIRCPESHCGALVYKPLYLYGDDIADGMDMYAFGHNCFYHEGDDRLLSLMYKGEADADMIDAYERYCALYSLQCILSLFSRGYLVGVSGYDNYMRVVRNNADYLARAFTYGICSADDFDDIAFSWDRFDVLFLHMVAVNGFAPSGYVRETFLYNVSRLYGHAFQEGEFPDVNGLFNGYDAKQVRTVVDIVCSALKEQRGLDSKIRALHDGVPYEDVIA